MLFYNQQFYTPTIIKSLKRWNQTLFNEKEKLTFQASDNLTSDFFIIKENKERLNDKLKKKEKRRLQP